MVPLFFNPFVSLLFMASLRLISLVLAVVLFQGCAPLEPDLPVDEEGEPIDLPPPGEDWLFFESVEPQEEISTRPTIEINFNSYLDPETFNSYGTFRMRSGGLTNAGRVDYWMTRRQLRFRPNADLEPRLSYQLQLLADDLRSITGSPLHTLAILPRLHTSEDLEPTDPLRRPEVSWEEVEAIFEIHCNDCHSDPNWMLPELTRESLIHKRSEQVDARLVEPFSAPRSYLMHKILPDYPLRRKEVQPPSWSDAPPLSMTDVERIEHWIANGAPP